MQRQLGSTVAALWVSCVIGAFATARAQAPTDSAASISDARPATMIGGALHELLSVYVPRGESEIRRLLEDARNLERSASNEIDEARRLATEADGRARIMKEEIQTTKVRRDVAGKTGDKTARAELDATLKRQSHERRYLERMRDALRADADRLEAEKEAANRRVKAMELELRVAEKQAEIAAQPGDPEKVSQYRSLLRDLLEAQKQSADRWVDASQKRKRVAERRIQQLQSLSKLSR